MIERPNQEEYEALARLSRGDADFARVARWLARSLKETDVALRGIPHTDPQLPVEQGAAQTLNQILQTAEHARDDRG